MDEETFKKQISRLETQWPSAYGIERRKVLWQALQTASSQFFEQAVQTALADHKGSAPLLADLTKYLEQARLEYNQQRTQAAAGFSTLITRAAESDKCVNPEFAKDAKKIYDDYVQGKLSREEFDQACDLLDVASKQYSQSANKPEKAVVPTRTTAIPYRTGDKDNE